MITLDNQLTRECPLETDSRLTSDTDVCITTQDWNHNGPLIRPSQALRASENQQYYVIESNACADTDSGFALLNNVFPDEASGAARVSRRAVV